MARKKPWCQTTAMNLSVPCRADLESKSSHSVTIGPAESITTVVPSLHAHAVYISGQKSYARLCTCRQVEKIPAALNYLHRILAKRLPSCLELSTGTACQGEGQGTPALTQEPTGSSLIKSEINNASDNKEKNESILLISEQIQTADTQNLSTENCSPPFPDFVLKFLIATCC